MIKIEPHKAKILAAHFAATTKTTQPPNEFKAFVSHQHPDAYQSLKRWWDDMDALRVLRTAELQRRIHVPETELPPNPIDDISGGEDGIIRFAGEQIGKIHTYYRTVLPQEIQIRLAYDSLIERFMGFLQRERCAIRLSENQLTVALFIPATDFQLADEWQRFVQFAYSEEELYKSFTLFVNNWRLSNRKGGRLGYVRFPSVTEHMRYWQAAFYIATLRGNIRKPDDKRGEPDSKERKEAKKEELNQILLQLRGALRTSELKQSFDKAENLSWQFNTSGSSQVPSAKAAEQIPGILTSPTHTLECPIAPVNQMRDAFRQTGGDKVAERCYGCGSRFSPKREKQRFKQDLKANRFVFSAPVQRLQSGGSSERPPICPNCLAIAFASPVKLAKGAIVVRLSSGENSEMLSTEKYLRMLTLGELNLIAGRNLLIHCSERVQEQERGGSKPVSEKIGQVQYALWRVAQTLPTAALEKMRFRLFAGESDIPLETRHLLWLSYLNDSFSPRLIMGNGKDNMRLCQAIRLIQKDEVIAAIYTLATAESTEAKPIGERSYSEKRSLEELREKHCYLLQPSSKGDKSMAKREELYRDVAALTGLTYAYCDYVRGELRKSKKSPDTVQREVKKLIEKVVNPSFFNYGAAEALPGTRATMYRNDDNYFCYDEAKRLLQDTLKVEISTRGPDDKKGQKPNGPDTAPTQETRESDDKKGQKPLSIYFDDILNAYAVLTEKYNKAQQRELAYQLKLNLYAKFASLFREENNRNGD